MSGFSLCFGLYGLENFCGGNPRGLVDIARQAEQAGFDQLTMTDHVVMGTRTDRYPYGDFPTPPDMPWLEPIVTQTVIAAGTDKIEISQGVLIAPLRPAALLAKQVATLDTVAPGRVVLGLGTGWQREEYEASGLPFKTRKAYLFEQIAAMKTLWRDAPANYQGELIQLNDIYCSPRPAKDIPCWVGVKATEENCRLIASVADGWIPIEQDPAAYAGGIAALRKAFEDAGRDPATLSVRAMLDFKFTSEGVPDLDATLAQIPAMLEVGVTHIEILPIVFIRSLEEFPAFCEKVVATKQRFGR